MWQNRGRLAHVLPPAAYGSPERHARELTAIFAPSWHIVATDGALATPGAFVSRSVLDTRVLVENREGEIHACVDRARPGRAALRTAADRGPPLLTATHGALVFVRLSPEGPTLQESLGDATLGAISRWLPAGARLAVELSLSHACNWKIPLENVLETYHLASLHDNVLARHPEVFRVFTPRRDGVPEAHELGPLHTAYHASMGGDSRLYRAFLRWAHPTATVDYVHHHAFPNVVIGHTAFVSYLQIVEPTSPTTCRNVIRLFLDVGGRRARALGNALSPVIDRASRRLIELVMAEDAAVYADVQRGLAASTQRGVLGANEERVHAFQRFVAARVAATFPEAEPNPQQPTGTRTKTG